MKPTELAQDSTTGSWRERPYSPVERNANQSALDKKANPEKGRTQSSFDEVRAKSLRSGLLGDGGASDTSAPERPVTFSLRSCARGVIGSVISSSVSHLKPRPAIVAAPHVMAEARSSQRPSSEGRGLPAPACCPGPAEPSANASHLPAPTTNSSSTTDAASPGHLPLASCTPARKISTSTQHSKLNLQHAPPRHVQLLADATQRHQAQQAAASRASLGQSPKLALTEAQQACYQVLAPLLLAL